MMRIEPSEVLAVIFFVGLLLYPYLRATTVNEPEHFRLLFPNVSAQEKLCILPPRPPQMWRSVPHSNNPQHHVHWKTPLVSAIV